MKRCLASLIIKKCKLKPQQDTSKYLLACLKLKRLTITSAGEDVEELDLSDTADMKIKWYVHFEKWFGSFFYT